MERPTLGHADDPSGPRNGPRAVDYRVHMNGSERRSPQALRGVIRRYEASPPTQRRLSAASRACRICPPRATRFSPSIRLYPRTGWAVVRRSQAQIGAPHRDLRIERVGAGGIAKQRGDRTGGPVATIRARPVERSIFTWNEARTEPPASRISYQFRAVVMSSLVIPGSRRGSYAVLITN